MFCVTKFTYSEARKNLSKLLNMAQKQPTSVNIDWKDIEALFMALGAEISEREGSRIGVHLLMPCNCKV